MSAEIERAAIRTKYPDEFRLGYRAGFRGEPDEPCDEGGYPPGFHTWPLERCNAWFAGVNAGLIDLEKLIQKVGGDE
jgi:hypothetical protein